MTNDYSGTTGSELAREVNSYEGYRLPNYLMSVEDLNNNDRVVYLGLERYGRLYGTTSITMGAVRSKVGLSHKGVLRSIEALAKGDYLNLRVHEDEVSVDISGNASWSE